MGYKKVYNNSSDILTIITEDCTGRKINKFKTNIEDKENIAKILNFIIDKYGLGFKIVKKDGASWLDIDESFKW